MCRWLAYSGSPVLLEELLYKPKHSLIVQSLHSQLGAEETNGDGFGVGWYGAYETPAVFHSVNPAWNDRNLREMSGHITSGLVFAHIRASTGSPVQQTNCHPFRYGRWLWMHNGLIFDFAKVHRDLALEVDPSLYPHMEGTTDSEVFFHLALTYGLEDDPVAAVERAVGFIETTGRRHGVEYPIQGTMATTDGESIWGFRYSSEHKSRSLFYSTDVQHAARTAPGQRHSGRGLRRREAGRLRAPRQPRRGVERGARIVLRRDPARARRAPSVQPANVRSRPLISTSCASSWLPRVRKRSTPASLMAS